MNLKQILKYRNDYSSEKLWKKLKEYAKVLGREVVYHILVLYYVMIDSKTPLKYKAIITGALGYLILPTDLIPDAIPGLGFSDDVAAIMAAYKAVKSSISPEIENRARIKLQTWFK